MLNVIMLSVIMLSVIILSVIMLSVTMLSVIMLSVVAPPISSTNFSPNFVSIEDFLWPISHSLEEEKCLKILLFTRQEMAHLKEIKLET
jgi:hypothetical protein